MSESELFRGYESEYFEVANSMKRQVAQIKNQSGEARKRTLQQLSKNLERADSLLRDMEQEVASIAKRDIRDKLNTRLKTVSGDIAKTRSEFEAQKNRGPNSGSERDSLLGGGGGAKKDEFQIAEDDYRSRLAQSTRSVERTSDSLQRSMQILDETEQMGVQTAEDVKRQGEQLRRTRDRLHDANEELTVGSRIIGRLSRRQITNRIIIILIILLMLVVIGILVFFIVRPFVKKKKPSPAQSPSPSPSPPAFKL